MAPGPVLVHGVQADDLLVARVAAVVGLPIEGEGDHSVAARRRGLSASGCGACCGSDKHEDRCALHPCTNMPGRQSMRRSATTSWWPSQPCGIVCAACSPASAAAAAIQSVVLIEIP